MTTQAERFVILQVSDAHLGQPHRGRDSDEVLTPLIDDIRKVVKERSLRPDLIVFNGDLTFGQVEHSPLPDQFDLGLSFLRKIFEAASVEWGRTPFLMVPGNHDLDRTRIDPSQTNWIASLKDQESDDEVYRLMTPGNLQWQRFIERQVAFAAFVERLGSPTFELAKDLLLQTGIITVGSTRIGIAGLNSSWACSGEDLGTLWIGRSQLQRAYENLRDCDFRIAIAHHPLSWLAAGDRQFVKQRIQTQYQVFLHGHEHSSWFTDSDGHLIVEAGACYQGSKKANAYAWIDLDFTNHRGELHLREYEARGSGGWVDLHIPGKQEIRPGVYEIRHLFPQPPSIQTENEGQLEILEAATDSTPDIPGIEYANRISLHASILDFIKAVEDGNNFRWEPGTFKSTERSPVVYWPVRLRSPSAIHAVQAFAAAGLQKCGATIHLCIDDLGHKEHSIEHLRDTLQKWIMKVGGDANSVTVSKFSEIIAAPSEVDPWPQVHQWLGESNYLLDQVLKVSKLLGPGTTLDQLVGKRPRRLLTPVVVWTVLRAIYQRASDSSVITLSGFDERPLWQAWRECGQVGAMSVAHLYIPKLLTADNSSRPLHMENTPLAWESKEDIRTDLNAQLTDDWRNPNQILMWSLQQCVLLPRFVAGTQERITTARLGENAKIEEIVSPLVDSIAEWVLERS